MESLYLTASLSRQYPVGRLRTPTSLLQKFPDKIRYAGFRRPRGMLVICQIVLDEGGSALQEAVWEELWAKLEKIAPGVTDVIR